MHRQRRDTAEIGPELLVEQFGDYLYTYALRYFREPATAEDLVQETFLAALKGWESFEGGSSRKTWLVSILRHKIFDQLRKRARERSPASSDTAGVGSAGVAERDEAIVDGAAELEPLFGFAYNCDDHWLDERAPSSWSESPERLVEQREFLSAVERCLSKLPDRLRQAFLLREMEDCSAAEVGQQLAITEGNARVLLHRTRLLLRDCLQFSWFAASR